MNRCIRGSAFSAPHRNVSTKTVAMLSTCTTEICILILFTDVEMLDCARARDSRTCRAEIEPPHYCVGGAIATQRGELFWPTVDTLARGSCYLLQCSHKDLFT